MKALLTLLTSLWRYLRQRMLDDAPDLDKIKFKEAWDSCKTPDNTEEDAERARQRIVARLKHDYEDRMKTLSNSGQQAGATASVLALLMVGVGLLLQNKLDLLQNLGGKSTTWLIAIAIVTLTNSYLPKFLKAWTSSYVGAGEYAARAKDSDYASAELLRQDIQTRNKTAQRMKRRMSAAKVLIGLSVLVIALWVTVL